MKYKIAHFNWMELDEARLITNDTGKYLIMKQADFQDFLEGKLSEDSEVYSILENYGFLYQDKESYVYDFEYDLFNMKHCLLTGTQLFIIVLTDSCNQRCVYCQAGGVHNSQISLEVCKKAIDIAVQSPVAKATIEFQGGEPTLNPAALYYTIPYAKKVFQEKGKKVDFAIVTNLTNPDANLLRWLIEQDVHISTSLDGNREVHEFNRPMANHKSSYNAWHDGAKLYLSLCRECNKMPIISAIQTTTRKSLQYPREILNEYLDNSINRLYIRPLTPLGCAYKKWEKIGYRPEEYVDFYCKMIDDMMKKCISGINVSEMTASIFLTRILNNESVGHTEFRSPCGAGVGQMAINYDGNIYTCDEGRMIANMGDPIFKIGDINNTYRELLQSPTVHAVCTASCIEGLPFCSDCAFSPYCSVCPVINYGFEGDLITRNENAYRCVISKGILKYLFKIINNNNPDEIAVLRRWANNS